MNNKGQVLVCFIVLIPLLVAFGALMIDSGYIVSEKVRLNSINEITIRDGLERNLEEKQIKEEIKANDEKIKIIKFQNKDGLSIHLQKDIDSIFGKIIGYDHYEINSNLTGSLEKGKVRIEG